MNPCRFFCLRFFKKSKKGALHRSRLAAAFGLFFYYSIIKRDLESLARCRCHTSIWFKFYGFCSLVLPSGYSCGYLRLHLGLQQVADFECLISAGSSVAPTASGRFQQLTLGIWKIIKAQTPTLWILRMKGLKC